MYEQTCEQKNEPGMANLIHVGHCSFASLSQPGVSQDRWTTSSPFAAISELLPLEERLICKSERVFPPEITIHLITAGVIFISS